MKIQITYKEHTYTSIDINKETKEAVIINLSENILAGTDGLYVDLDDGTKLILSNQAAKEAIYILKEN